MKNDKIVAERKYISNIILLGIIIAIPLPILLLAAYEYLGPGLLSGMEGAGYGTHLFSGLIGGRVLVEIVNPIISITLYMILLWFTYKLFTVSKSKRLRFSSIVSCVIAGLVVFIICCWETLSR